MSISVLAPASAYGDLRHLLPLNYKRMITAWLEEDCPSLDYGGFVVGESEGEARLLGKSQVFCSQWDGWMHPFSRVTSVPEKKKKKKKINDSVIGHCSRRTLFR